MLTASLPGLPLDVPLRLSFLKAYEDAELQEGVEAVLAGMQQDLPRHPQVLSVLARRAWDTEAGAESDTRATQAVKRTVEAYETAVQVRYTLMPRSLPPTFTACQAPEPSLWVSYAQFCIGLLAHPRMTPKKVRFMMCLCASV